MLVWLLLLTPVSDTCVVLGLEGCAGMAAIADTSK